MIVPRIVPMLILSTVSAMMPAYAQDVIALQVVIDGPATMVRGVGGGDAQPLFHASWRPDAAGEGIVFDLQRTVEPMEDQHVMLDELLIAALGPYLDARIHFGHDGVNADGSPDQLLAQLNTMVWAAADATGAAGVFDGFTSPTRDQLIRLTRIDWSQASHSIDGSGEQDKYLAIYRFVRIQRDELERQLRVDLLPLSVVNVLAPAPLTAGQLERINSICGTVFDEQNFLCALNLTVSDSGTGLPDPRLAMDIAATIRPSPVEQVPEAKIRKRDRWLKSELDEINERIDALDQRKELWVLRDRLDDLEGGLDDLRLRVDEQEEARIAPSSDNPIANLSDLTGRNVTIRFERNSAEIGSEYRLLLNEVFEQLARSAEHRVLITGFTDRSGDAAMNLMLSEQRAKAVRSYLLTRGISPERILVNYYGDSRSQGRNPEERRVEVEWLR